LIAPLRRLTIIQCIALCPLFITAELLIPVGAEFNALSPYSLREKVLATLSEDKREFHLDLSPDISLLQDFLAPVLL